MKRPKIQQQVTFLGTNHLEKTANFYQKLLGLELILDQGKCLIFKVPMFMIDPSGWIFHHSCQGICIGNAKEKVVIHGH